MALVKYTNSYVDLSEANTYFADRLDVAAWDAAADAQKEQALVTATSLLDNMTWTGTAVSDSQTLAFPRYGQYFDPRYGADVILDDASIPARIETATFELAYHLLNNDGLLDDTGETDNLTVGSIVLQGIRKANTIPPFVKTTIRPLLQNRGAKHWWRSN
jgi:hypothetical protein